MMRATVFALSLLSAGCASGVVVELPQALPPRLGPGDVLELSWPEGKCKLTIAGDGTISHELFGTVHLAGLCLPEAQKTLRLAAKRTTAKQTPIFLRLIESRNCFVYVYGEVKTPGRYPYSRGMRLLDAISLAGGYVANRASSSVRLVRRTPYESVSASFNLSEILAGRQKNPPLEPGDMLFVPTSFMTKVADAVAYILQPVRSLIESLLGVASSTAQAAAATTTPSQ